MTTALCLLGRVILVYIWNVDLLLAYENVNEQNVFLMMLVRMSRWLIGAIEMRNQQNDNNNDDNNDDNNDNDNDNNGNINNNNIDIEEVGPVIHPRAPVRRLRQPAIQRRAVGIRRHGDLGGLDLNNILPERLRNRIV